jgi:sec-independent protein translocase protein TatB
MSMPDMMFIFFLALILFGPKKLPEIGRQIGKFMAEFKRASNDFKYQLQSEIDKAGEDVGTTSQPGAQPETKTGGQETSSFTQTLLPPSVKSAVSEIDNAHERLMQTARMAFDAQNFTLRPPEAPTIASNEAKPVSAPSPAAYPAETGAPELLDGAVSASHESFPVESVTDQPTPDSAPAKSNSAPQSS